MTIDLFLFCITVTLVTFSTVCVFAMSNPGYPKRSYGARNWGGYDKSYSQQAELISNSASELSTELSPVNDDAMKIGQRS